MAKRKQKPKAGKVVRITPDLDRLISTKRADSETVSETLRRLIFGESRLYVLPSDIFISLEEARGEAIVRRVKQKLTKAEKPVVLREAP
jgi:hypothetical protein